MSFVWPYALIALPLALAGVLLLFKTSQRARQRLLGNFAAQRLLPLLLASHSPVLRRLKQGLLAGGVLLTVLALARPQWGYDWEEKQSRGVDVIFVLDTSKSMLAQDVQPSRLERAKLAILDSVEKMGGNRIGLVAFAGDAFLLCPLTLDYDAFRQTLEAVDVNTIARGGTDIGSGLDEAATALEKSGNHKIIVLLTDGEDLEGEGVNEAKALAEQNVTIYTVGVGTPQGEIIPIRDANGGTDFVRDQRGEIVKSHLDAATLTGIAEATHGFYQPLGATGEGLTRVYEEGIKKIPEQSLSAQMQRQPIERYQWPLGVGALLLAIEMLIGTRRPSWRRSNLATVNLAEPLPVSSARRSSIKPTPERKPPVIAAALLLTLFLGGYGRSEAADSPAATQAADASQPTQSVQSAEPAPPAQTGAAAPTPSQQYSIKEAQSLFQKGDYLGAAEAYGQAADATQDGRFRYDQGESLYRGGNFDAAADAFSKTLSSNDLQLQQRAYYNLGNTNFRLGQADIKDDPKKAQASWEDAVKDYQNALELNSNDADARYNLGVVKQQIEELKKQMEQQKQQQDKPDQQQNQTQQNQSQQNQQQNQSQQNQSGQQNDSQQNQPQNSQSQSQNQSGQQKQSSSDNNQNPPNASGSQNQSQNGQKQSGQKNSPSPANKPNQQNSAGPQNQPQQGQRGQQNKPGDQNQPGNQPDQSGQKPGDQNKNGPQPQPASQAGKEPGQQNAGQTKAAAVGGTSGAAAGSPKDGDQTVNGTVAAGGMTREEARQLLDSLKSNEHKLPASNLQNSNGKPSTDQYQKDW